MKRLLILSYLCICIISLRAEISVKSCTIREKDLDARINYPVKDQNGDLCALIKVITTEKGFSFDAGQLGIMKTEQKNAEIWVYVPFGIKHLRIQHEKLGTCEYNFNVNIEKATVYELELVNAKVGYYVVQTIDAQNVIIKPTPLNSKVFIDDDILSIHDREGNYSRQMPFGHHSYRIEADKYDPEAGGFDAKSDSVPLKLFPVLKPAFGSLHISSTPEDGATVYIDHNKVLGKTPVKLDSLKRGEHIIEIEREMYVRSKPRTVVIIAGQVTDLSIDLKPQYATVTIKAPPEAKIFIDKEEQVTKNTGIWTGRIEKGMHHFEAQMASCRPDQRYNVTLVAGENKVIELNPLPIYGSVSITSDPLEAAITIDGKEYGLTPKILNKLLIGKHKVQFSKQGYASTSEDVTILEGINNKEIKAVLNNGEEVVINSKPTGATLFIDGQDKGLTPFREFLAFGEHEIKLEYKNETGADIHYQSPFSKQIKASDVDKEFNIDIPIEERKVKFISTPQAAQLSIDGKVQGNTPQDVYLKNGRHVIALEKSKYDNKTDQIFIDDNSLNAYQYTLVWHVTNRSKGKQYYNTHPITIACGYHHTDFLNNTFQDNISEHHLQKKFGQAFTFSVNPFPFKIDITGFDSQYESLPSATVTHGTEFQHRGVELSLSYYLFNMGKHLFFYGGGGYQFSELHYGKNFGDFGSGNSEAGKIKTSTPIAKAGVQCTAGSFMIFGEYVQSLFSADQAKCRQLYFGVGFNL